MYRSIFIWCVSIIIVKFKTNKWGPKAQREISQALPLKSGINNNLQAKCTRVVCFSKIVKQLFQFYYHSIIQCASSKTRQQTCSSMLPNKSWRASDCSASGATNSSWGGASRNSELLNANVHLMKLCYIF